MVSFLFTKSLNYKKEMSHFSAHALQMSDQSHSSFSAQQNIRA